MKPDQPTDEAYAHASWMLLCEARAMRAFAAVEAGRFGAFLDDDRPVILFERHKFDQFTDHRFRSHLFNGQPISDPTPGGYGAAGVYQHEKLGFAAELDHEAALESCSWGLFQIMGFNHERAGFPDLQRFINAMYRSVDDHLRALVLFIRFDQHLVDAIRKRDWAMVAFLYNGPNYAVNHYDKKMEAAYNSFQ